MLFNNKQYGLISFVYAIQAIWSLCIDQTHLQSSSIFSVFGSGIFHFGSENGTKRQKVILVEELTFLGSVVRPGRGPQGQRAAAPSQNRLLLVSV